MNCSVGAAMNRIPLSRIHSNWRGSFVPSAFEAVKRGIEREKARLHGSTFLALLFRQEYDYDGLTERLELLKGFPNEASAVQYVEQLAAQELATSLGEPGSCGNAWRRNASREDKRFKPNREGARVRCAKLRSFEIKKDTGYDSKRVQFEVLHVDPVETVGSELLAYFDAESEWVDYFISKGKHD